MRNPRFLRRALKDGAGVDGDIVPRFHAQPPLSFPRTPLDDLPDIFRLMVRPGSWRAWILERNPRRGVLEHARRKLTGGEVEP